MRRSKLLAAKLVAHMHGVARRKLQTPGTAEQQKRQETPTINAIDREHTSQTKHQALLKGQPGRRITPIKTTTMHASAQQLPAIINLTQQGHHYILSAYAARCEA